MPCFRLGIGSNLIDFSDLTLATFEVQGIEVPGHHRKNKNMIIKLIRGAMLNESIPGLGRGPLRLQ